MNIDKLEFVRQQCRTISGAKHYKGYTMIRCPFHSDKTPSGRISHSDTTKSPGFFRCYGCGKTASWNELAPLINCQPFDQKPNAVYASFQEENTSVEYNEKLNFSPLPPNKRWRNIKTNLLKEIGCKLCRVDYGSQFSKPFVYMPCKINGELKGYIKARMHKEPDKPSYINSKGSWTAHYGLFPFDYVMNMDGKNVVLVEGQRDALRLIQHGIPAMCILGTQNWTDFKAGLLELNGIEKAYVFMDADNAGIEGTKKVYSSLSKYVNTSIIKLWEVDGNPYKEYNGNQELAKKHCEMWDPGNCPVEVLDWLYRRIYDN